MKKVTLVVSLLLAASFTFAQYAGVYAPITDKAEKTALNQTRGGEEVYWSISFDEDPSTWTIAHDQGDNDWVVSDTTITPLSHVNGTDFTDDGVPVGTAVSSMWLYMGRRDVGEYSESGGEFAYFDVISSVLGGTETAHNSWIQFDDVDLSEVDYPKLQMFQNFKALNSGATYIDYSLDDGANWTSIRLNEDVEGNQYGDKLLDVILPVEIGGNANVDFRFRYQADNTSVNGYGWEIDDIKIVRNPDVDMLLKKGVANFFEYLDYTNVEYADRFHISSHYGMIPEEQFLSEGAALVFNGIVMSKGNLEITPDFNVRILDPEMSEIYNETVAAAAMNTLDVDTVDVLVEFGFEDLPAQGEYTVIYSISGTDDPNPNDNIDTTYFHVTDEIFGRDLDNMTGSTGPTVWQNGGNNGDMIGTNYTFLYETTVESMDVFISSSSDAGTAMVAHIMQYDSNSDDWVDIANSAIVIVEENMIGDWYRFTFADPIEVLPDSETGAFTVKAVLEFSNVEAGDLMLGYDPTVPASSWGTTWFFTQGDNALEWYAITNWSAGGVGIRLNTIKSDNAVADINSDNVAVYPNPTNGIFNIENVRGADVEVFNLMGQSVYSATEVNENISVDLSDLSEGTYVVRVSGINTVKTQKINLVK